MKAAQPTQNNSHQGETASNAGKGLTVNIYSGPVIQSGGDANIGGDVVGRDKIDNTVESK